MWLSSGAEFAGYTIDRMLGFGATGEVYLVQRAGLVRHDALKVLSVALSADPEFRERFTGEAELATTLHHPHIVEAHQRGEFEGRLWTAMDYVDGETAATVVAQRHAAGMPVGQAVGIIAAVAGALDYAHRRGILHRGVRPTNILLPEPDGGKQRVLLGDFGIVRNGVDDYAAPEQIKGLAVDERTDQYGLAATAYFLLSGIAPGARLGAIPRLGDRRPELAALDDVLVTALAENPDQRFGRCSAFAAALSERAQACAGGYGPTIPVVDYPDYPDDGQPRSASSPGRSALLRKWPVALAAVLVAAGLGGGVWIGRSTSSSTQVADPTTAAPVPAAVPPTTTSVAAAVPDQLLDGTFQIDVNRALQTYNDNPAPQPPNVSTWWALRSRCTASACLAGGVQLDDEDHQQLSAGPAIKSLVLDFHSGAWQSRPQTVRFACIGKDGSTLEQSTTQVLVLRPQASGPLRGEMTVIVESDECGQQGGKFSIPAVAGRTGPVPPDVTVPLPDR